jgi:hypothetical protein
MGFVIYTTSKINLNYCAILLIQILTCSFVYLKWEGDIIGIIYIYYESSFGYITNIKNKKIAIYIISI